MTFKFNQLLRLVIGISLTLVSFSCTEFLKGKPKKQDVITLENKSLECTKQLKDNFEKMLNSELSEQKIDETFDCLNKTIELFIQKVEGKQNANQFTAEELLKIMNQFQPEAEMTIDSTREILNLKKALFGGAIEFITKNELELVRNYLKLVQVESKKNSEFMQIYSFDLDKNKFSSDFIKAGFKQLRESLKTLLGQTQIYKSEYNYTDFVKLLETLNVDKTAEDKKNIKMLGNVMYLIQGDVKLKSESDYHLAIDNLVDLAELYAEFTYAGLEFKITEKKQFSQLIMFMEKSIQILESSVQYKFTKLIKVESIDPLIIELLDKKVIPLDVKKETFLDFYKRSFLRVFNDNKSLAPESFKGLSEIIVKNIKREFYVFKTSMDFINSIKFDLKNSYSVVEIQLAMKKFNPQDWLRETKALDPALRSQVIQGFEELRMEALGKLPIIYEKRKMVLAFDQNKTQLDWLALTEALYNKLLARALLIGWGVVSSDLDLNKSYLLEEGMFNWYADFKQFGVEIKLFDPRTVNNGPDSFLEASLFTGAGQGAKKLTYLELLQFVNMLVTGGGFVVDEIRQDMIAVNCGLPEKDVFNFPWLNEDCFRKQLHLNQKKYFSHLPYFSAFLTGLTEAQYNSYFADLMEVSRKDALKKGRIETADIRTLSMLTMYIESVYVTFDKDKPLQILSLKEVRTAYPRFRAFIREFAEKEGVLDGWNVFYNHCRLSYSEDDFIREAFVFMVYNGRLPVAADFNKFSCHTNGLFNIQGEVSRKNILNTFKVLKTVLASEE